MANTRSKKKEVEPVNEVVNAVTEETTESKAPSNKKGVVICQNLNMRKAPTLGSSILQILTKDTKIEIIDNADDAWYKVRTSKGTIGFCMKEFIKLGK